MKAISKILGVLIVAVLICGTGLGAYFGFRLMVKTFSSFKYYVDPITAMAWSITLLSALIIASAIRRAGQEQKATQIHKDKSEAYQVFVNVWRGVLDTRAAAEEGSHSKKKEDLNVLDGLLTLYASPDVLKAHAALRALEFEERGQDQHVWSQFSEALLAIRRDLGTESRGLRAKEVVQLLRSESDNLRGAPRPVGRPDAQPLVSLVSNS